MYDFILVVQCTIDNSSYNQEITAKLNDKTIGIDGDNYHLMSPFIGQCKKGDIFYITSYRTGGSYITFYTRLIMIPNGDISSSSIVL